MGKNWNKFKLLMWKNYVLQKRNLVQTAIEIVAPILFSLYIVAIRTLTEPEHVKEIKFIPYDPLNCPYTWSNISLLYAPSSPYSDKIMKIFEKQCSDHGNFNVIQLKNQVEIESYYRENEATVFGAIQFPDEFSETSDHTEITIRPTAELKSANGQTWLTNLIYPPYQMPGPREANNNYGATPNYHTEFFLHIQKLLYSSLVLNHKGINIDNFENISEILANTNLAQPDIQMQRFPYPAYIDDVLLTALMSMCGVIIMLSFVYSAINIVKAITTEKEKQLKEAMKIMGLSNWLHWTAWFVKTFIFLLISCIIMVFLFKIRVAETSLFPHGDPSVMIVFLIFYIMAVITFCFAISVFFSKANTAGTVSGLLWFLSYAPYMFLQENYATLSLSAKLFASLGANTCMSYGFQIMLMYEGTQEGIQWSNVFKGVTPDDDLNLGFLTGMLIVDSIIYLLIALYVESVFPGEFGVALPWYYPFTKSYWTGNPVKVHSSYSDEVLDDTLFEKPPSNLEAGLEIKNLRKVFAQNTAVNNLSLKMYKDQITVLLGHNGAGKTTTMSMLTGMITPTSGTAVINGHDIRTDMTGVRDSLGLCPQHNIIFDNLTVSEHLYFFSKLKGLDDKEVEEEINKYIELLELQPKKNSRSKTLSGGMKRKLCVGMALCGNSQVIMLDEPTAGMDPSARRALWEFLQCQKQGRTILLTTHYMDEADLLGDRIAIMANGELQCCGSSFFLKKKYGAGYHLIMEKSKECKSWEVTALLKKYIPNIEVEGDVGSELTYSLEEEQSQVFESMLKELENNFEKLGVRSYGISLTTLEEVFLKVGADHIQESNQSDTESTKDMRLDIPSSPSTKLTGLSLMVNQSYAMLMKKFLSAIRSWIMLFLLLILPVIFLIITMVSARTAGAKIELSMLKLNMDKWKKSSVLTEGPSDNAYLTQYKKWSGNNMNFINVADIEAEALQKRKDIPSTFRYYYITGLKYFKDNDNENLTAYFNNDAYHSPGIAYSLILNAVYSAKTNKTLSFNNFPLPPTSETQIKEATAFSAVSFGLPFNIGFSMSFACSIFINFIIRERVSNSKHLQLVSGVKAFIFWIVTFVCDYIIFLLMVVMLMLTLLCFQEDGFTSAEDLQRFIIPFIPFGFALLPFLYWAGFMFKTPQSGYTKITMLSVLLGCIGYMVVKVLLVLLDEEAWSEGLGYVFLLIPHYALMCAIGDGYSIYKTNKVCAMYTEAGAGSPAGSCPDPPDTYFQWTIPGMGMNLAYSMISGFVMMLGLIIYEYKILTNVVYKLKLKYFKHLPTIEDDMDSDVLEEKRVISDKPIDQLKNEYTFVMKDVTKYYDNLLAVNGLCLGAKSHECFGLLGINGAGKTTTFKMMTGDIKMSHGDAWINGYSIKSEIKKVQKYIGYCPQFDALLDDLTPRETIKMFALLRGIPKRECDLLAVKLAEDFDFTKHIDKKVKQLSGGNKRKLSTSVALIGDPPILYLDEPTAGMDPATKRFLWNSLCKVRDSGKLIVLTSHSMEECEALCTRIAIMVNGNFKCLGSTQHLKSKFAKGYTITIKVKKLASSHGDNHSDTAPVEGFIKQNFPNATVRERHQELLTYYLTDTVLPWSQMFGILEKAKRDKSLNIEDYSLGQSSLEQVFLTFTKQQKEDNLLK
ncbi:unnamed protein product [Brassicogethes aeneus]|uniref:ABC transporter domain-containing protein n=1 Tax=Brassicogethes aeneus TaxID=1431903 RepID=A0A9P0F806_BRAAE|nr:unnamed protein product [Brassicogethes aeneus]